MMRHEHDIHAATASGEADRFTGEPLYRFAAELYPWHRAVTGAGVRRTLQAISQRIPIEVHSVPTGTKVLDWEVPEEWEIRDASVRDSSGDAVIDYRASNLHVVSYSVPVDRSMPWDELREHLHTLPEHPDWIPYRAAHFQKVWGFCLSHRQYEQLAAQGNRTYHVRIDAQQHAGILNYGELLVPGRSRDELLLTTHICHPSLANDNLSGIVVATELARQLLEVNDRPLSVRLLFLPATIGAITWLARNQQTVSRIRGGLVLANLGDPGGFTYKTSRRGNSLIDQVVSQVFNQSAANLQTREFTPWGYDERQFCSPGFNLPIGRLTRTPEGEYPQYHTSADDLDLIQPDCLGASLQIVSQIVSTFAAACGDAQSAARGAAIEGSASAIVPAAADAGSLGDSASDNQRRISMNRRWLNTRPYGEPRLGTYGLYQGYGSADNRQLQQAVLWILNLSDGDHTFGDMAQRSRMDPTILNIAAEKLVDCGLLREIS